MATGGQETRGLRERAPLPALGAGHRAAGGQVWRATVARRSPEARRREVPDIGAGQDVDPAVTALYERHYRSLVRLAALLVRDVGAAEEIVQDSFAALHCARRRRDNDFALSYLHQSVVNRSRSVLPQRAAGPSTAEPSGRPTQEQRAMTGPQHPAVVSALHARPARQREAVILRYYADLSEAQIAAAMGISRRAVKSHIAQAMTALRVVIDRAED